ncbi:CysZ protein [Nocardia transvalensis]|uniref:CysZ protein n=1 Tax=Nocardia transvalensis TaxID=37333 RepID=A0A7W9UFY6_9NOCA|nr:EI24 domain-containing protein [Nocardia transvalensis]MBB5911506.1 CysZ protein [Nocardia transvalensis]
MGGESSAIAGLGLVPGLIALVLYLAALIALVVFAGDIVGAATPFADTWDSPWPGLLRGFLAVLLVVLGLLLSVLTFTAVTLAIGQPFYENLSEQVDRSESPDGTAPESGLPFWRELWISVRDSLRILVRAAFWGILLFAAGFLPVVGQTVVPVLALCVTGYFLTQELASIALARRGLHLRDQLALLRSRRMLVWGFGIPLAAVFLIPFVAVLLMPGAVAGATLLARDLTEDPGQKHAGKGVKTMPGNE